MTETQKIGVLLINLGTPAGTSIPEVRAYLKEFLDDPRVIDLPTIVRKILLYAFILPFRPKKSAHAYQQIWDPKRGSPLLYNTQDLALAVSQKLPANYIVAVGMRYGNPSIKVAVDQLLSAGCGKIIALPLFAQYSSAATGSAMESLFKTLSQRLNIPSLALPHAFYNDPGFIQAQAAIIAPYWQKRTAKTRLVFSYHSLPLRHIVKSGCNPSCARDKQCPSITEKNKNCYRAQCFETSRLLADQLGLATDYAVVFQSRLGRTEWIGPDVQNMLPLWHKAGIQDLIVACPSFVADCLETLEEIGVRLREEWQKLSAGDLHLVPCLNADPRWVETVTNWVREQS